MAAAVVALLAGGCALQPPPKPEETRSQAMGATDVTTPWRAGDQVSGTVQDNWLATFNDAQLNTLVAEAVQRNPDLRVAATKVEQATEQLRIAEAARRPQISIVGTGGIKVTDASSALTGIIGLVSWELDLWGQLRYQREVAAATLTSVQADTEFARQSIAATTAKAWFIAAQTLGEQQLAADMVTSSEHLVKLAGDRYRIGAGSDQDVALSNANLGVARDSLVQARYAHQAAVRALELLLGRYPATELRARPDLPPLPGPVPAGLPLQMLERRPDMIAAERRVAAAFNRVGSAKAAELPAIRLTGNVGYISSDIVELKQDYNNPSVGLGAKLVAPIYTGGGLDAQVELMNAQQREAVAQYAKLALRAIGDVEESLAMARTLAEREVLLKAITTDQARAFDLAQTAYRVGKQDLRSVEQQALSLYATRVNLLRVQGEQLSQRVALHLSLGGSFGERVALSDAKP
ncbi:MAG TPA: efflux transporter outer membrane subunit [Burkholderiaceae bacterium]|nr:efflux transporter outer membrane subunit [Burkholderiaceae bacterium]